MYVYNYERSLPNWSDAEICFLIESWKDHHPISKNLEDEYKRVKDHNSKRRNDHESFTYYEELNEILGS